MCYVALAVFIAWEWKRFRFSSWLLLLFHCSCNGHPIKFMDTCYSYISHAFIEFSVNKHDSMFSPLIIFFAYTRIFDIFSCGFHSSSSFASMSMNNNPSFLSKCKKYVVVVGVLLLSYSIENQYIQTHALVSNTNYNIVCVKIFVLSQWERKKISRYLNK